MEVDEDNDSAEVFVYDSIGSFWGVEASVFVQELSQITANNIMLRVNSPGGDVYDALAIMNALKRHKAKVTATVDGLAASAASFILQAADEIQMGKGAELMIHDASTITIGNAAELREDAEFLDKISNTIASIYADRAGGTTEEWRDRMVAETWFSAEEAVEAGLADSIVGNDAEAEDLKNKIDFSVFAYAGRRAAPAPAAHNSTPTRRDIRPHLDTALAVAQEWQTTKAEAGSPTKPTPQEGADMSDKLTQGVCERLGIKKSGAEVTDELILDALDEALQEQAQGDTIAAAGIVTLDESQYQQLVNDASAGRAARDQQVAEKRAKVVDDAIQTGRIAPARRQHWIDALTADPGMEETLGKLAPGLVPVNSKGFTGGVDEASDEDHVYAKYWGDEKEGK